ncbi:histidine ammonia-lyase [Methylobacterium terricola]|uniref:Histidine ammonia-lyase n=1 Tax=Methylobacterium terricola TaxID=2583531 RepID=A0A5C4L6F0_9HYPH|nr:histidine ammonia-lyase [Methylobacterium terricola]TNC06437.1 histidine ammonia-lyase [Methylobacterium terricola]
MPLASPSSVTLTGAPVSIDEIGAIARGGATVAVAASLRERLLAAREIVERYAREDLPAYGLTTGLGAGVDTRLAAEDLVAFQRRVPLARAVGVGAPLAREAVRALMAARLASMAAGGSGVSLAAFEALVAALNAGFHPVVPALGSIGAADLAPLAHVGRALLGEGEAEVDGEILPAAEALRRAGIAPVALEPKDGHAIVVANSLSTGQGCLAVLDIERLLDWSLLAASLNFEAFRANTGTFDPRTAAARPAFGQERIAAQMRALMAGSGLLAPGAARRLQDPLSYRCVPQIMGAVRHALDEARQATEIELASSGDNPVVLIEADLILSNGNFDATAFSLSWERLGQALAHGAAAAAQRTMKIMSPGLSELPRFLTPRGQSRTGFATVQKTVSALEAEIRHLAQPVSLSPLPVADGIEDHAAMAPAVLAKTGAIVERLRWLVAIELVAAAQAVELRGAPGPLGVGPQAAYGFVRDLCGALDEDRSLGGDFMRVAAAMAIQDGPASAAARADTHPTT